MRKTLPMIAASLFLFVVLSVVVIDSYPNEEESHTYDLLPDQEKVTYIQRDTRKGLSYAFYEKGYKPQTRTYIGTLQDLEAYGFERVSRFILVNPKYACVERKADNELNVIVEGEVICKMKDECIKVKYVVNLMKLDECE